ncbi:MAG: hypothetical protein NT144_03555 [Bacteroidia bacterium]|nr:hypothetical protein [Bacteroidia bacterium]
MKRRSLLKTLALGALLFKTNSLGVTLFFKEKLTLIKKIDISNESTEGGEIICYIEDNKLCKATIEQCWESGKHLIIILFSNDNKIDTVLEAKVHYNRPFYFTKRTAMEIGDTEWFDDNKTKILKNKFFFSDGKIIDFTTNYSKQSVDIKAVENYFNSRAGFIIDEINKKMG